MNTFLSKIKKSWTWIISILRPNKKKKKDSREDIFLREWTKALTDNAKMFNGLYCGLQRIVDGKAKKPEAVLCEWWTRTRYQWLEGTLHEISRETIGNISDGDYTKWAILLLKAADDAGIIQEKSEIITLDKVSASAYVEWNGEEIFVEDTVKIVNPAWYQNNRVVEEGHCILLEAGE